MRSPPSTDSNKNEGAPPRSFMYTLMGVSRSAEISRMTLAPGVSAGVVWVVVVGSNNIGSPLNHRYWIFDTRKPNIQYRVSKLKSPPSVGTRGDSRGATQVNAVETKIPAGDATGREKPASL